MMTEKDLLNPKNFNLDIFKKMGFTRQSCTKCKKNFWAGIKRDTCGDTTCDTYTFIGNPLIPKKYDWKTLRTKYIDWFEKEGHEPIGRYSTIARWKADTFYTGASIYCFQPWVVNRVIAPPANPLVMDQPSVRFGDIDNVGLGSGRHMTSFSMLAHHAFNYPKQEVYWKERTVDLCHRWFTDGMKIKPTDLVYVENLWKGGGNAGPCFEVFLGGNEIATLVFMEFSGPVDGKYSPMDLKVVDTGYGLERIAWASQGHPTIYYSVYPNIIDWLRKKSGVKYNNEISKEFCRLAAVLNVDEVDVERARDTIIDEVSKKLGMDKKYILEYVLSDHNVYRIADHAKTIGFILGDGVVPSNVQEGYLARLLIRRTIRSLKYLGIDVPMSNVVEKHIKDLVDVYPEFNDNKDDILNMVEVEQRKYKDSISRGKKVVAKMASSGTIKEDQLIELYNSHGILPADVRDFVGDNVKIAGLRDIDTKIAAQKETPVKEVKETELDVSGIPDTRKIYYEDERLYKFKANVLKVFDGFVVLDGTAFYPRGGGQEPDHGTIGEFEVYDVTRVGNVILHAVNGGKFKAGEVVECVVDEERREQIRKHHTAAHIINGAAQELFGNHVWQGGSKKDFDKAHLDLTHYAPLSPSEILELEEIANKIVRKNLKTHKSVMTRHEAESEFGFRIYQGGAVPGKLLRIMNIPDFDTEACGGTHCDSTGEVGEIVIIKVERPQDGIIRVVFASDKAAERYLKSVHSVLQESSKLLNVKDVDIVSGVKSLLSEWKTKKKSLEHLRSKRAGSTVSELEFEELNGVKVLVKSLDGADPKELQEISKQASGNNTVIVLFGVGKRIEVFGSSSSKVNVGKIVKDVCDILGGKGGGSNDVARGFGLDESKLDEAIKFVKGAI